MPLKKGKKAMSSNVKELMHTYKKTGKIGSSKPKSKKAAQKQAASIAYQQANESFDVTVNNFLTFFKNNS
jgi:hypothetical protein